MHQNKKYQFSNRKIYHSIPIGCAFALLLLGFVVINPASNSNSAFANNANNMARSSTVNTTLSMVIDNDTSMNPTYVEPGKTAYRSHIVKVSATDIMNYTLQLTAADGATTTLNNGSTAIPGTSAVAGKDMSSNTWGFTWGEVNSDNSEQTYYALPAYGSTGANMSTGLLESAQASDTNTADFTKKLTFAANLAEGSPSGHYTTTALLSLAATPKQLVFDGIETMQEMTSTICANATENDTTRLRDSRDGKYYWVAKLKDGNCWMTQNLALDLDTSKTLTPADTDVTANWTPENSTQKGSVIKVEVEKPISDKHRYYFYTYSYNPGLFLRSPISERSNLCKMADGSNIASPAQCAEYGWKNVSTLQPSVTLMDNTIGTSIIDETKGIYDAHYLTGNYYSFNAGTAGGAYELVGEYNSEAEEVADFSIVNQSICAKGWRLPGENGKTTSDFRRLANLYPSSSDNVTGNPVIAPLYLPMSGLVDFYDGSLSSLGWSAIIMGNTGEGFINNDVSVGYHYRNSVYQYSNILIYGQSSNQNQIASSIRCIAM